MQLGYPGPGGKLITQLSYGTWNYIRTCTAPKMEVRNLKTMAATVHSFSLASRKPEKQETAQPSTGPRTQLQSQNEYQTLLGTV